MQNSLALKKVVYIVTTVHETLNVRTVFLPDRILIQFQSVYFNGRLSISIKTAVNHYKLQSEEQGSDEGEHKSEWVREEG
jgi:hypothetical protein